MDVIRIPTPALPQASTLDHHSSLVRLKDVTHAQATTLRPVPPALRVTTLTQIAASNAAQIVWLAPAQSVQPVKKDTTLTL